MIRAWLIFAAIAALIVAGTTVLTVSTLRAERQRAADESLRQALWRLDGRATELLLSAAAVSAESPGLLRDEDLAVAHLEVDADGEVVAAAGTWSGDGLPAALAALRPALTGPGVQQAAAADPLSAIPQQSAGNYFGSRASNSQRLQSVVVAHRSSSGPVVARWAAGQLVLVRRVARGRDDLVQAVVLDWPRLQREFVADIADILPQARLEPAAEGDPQPDQLAALPARVLGGRASANLPPGVAGMLAAAWGAVGIGLLGAAAALIAAHRLAERRATFVSAVTHELRTPLTALRLHADLLADARVGGDPERRSGAVRILQGEAARLSRLVDNVLDYARLERRRPPRPQPTALADLLQRLLPSLTARLAEAGLTVEAAEPPSVLVRCDPDAVGRILANLVDNAAKYGQGPVQLSVAVAGGRCEVRLRDHGPGIPADLRLFVPFSRSAEVAAGSAPGVGLGLALCRRLARAQHGDLRLEAPTDGPGTCAVLSLPLA